jgi:uncharacterized protein (TIGR02231 family)
MYKISLLSGIILSVSLVNNDYTQKTELLPLSSQPIYSWRNDVADTARAEAVINNATVYFGYGAELVHNTKVKIDPGTKIIVINGLSTQVDISSLQISCPDDVALLSQRYSLYYPPALEPVKSKDILRLEDSLVQTGKEISRVGNLAQIEEEILKKTGSLIEATLSNSGNKTISSAEVLRLVEYYNTRIEKSKTAIFNYGQTESKLNEKLVEIKKRIDELEKINPSPVAKPVGQIILQVVCKKAEEIPVSFSYYTNNAGWTPVYDVRVNSKTNKVKLVYKASLTQTSGIDWKKTKLTLSTGTPNFGVAAPILTPWYLQLYVPALYNRVNNMLTGRVSGINLQSNTIQSMNDDKQLEEKIVLRGYGAEQQFYKASADSAVTPATLQDFTTLNEGQLNTNFDIELPYDIESDGQLHSVTIRDEEISCNLKNYSVPRLDREAYLLAEVADWQNLDLLPGEANIIMDDTYVGKSLIDPNTTADTLNLSLGKDKRVVVKKTLVKELSSLKTSGKDSRQTFTYEITVKNNKLTDINLLLKDQYPLSTIKEVEVKLEESSEALVNPETGVITWKLALKPGESRKYRFAYSVKYPRDKKIMNLK